MPTPSLRTSGHLAARPGSRAIGLIRQALLGILLLGIVGTTIELLLLEHFEDAWQWTPFSLFAIGVSVLAWYAVRRSAAAVRAFRIVMAAFIASGALGVYLHYSGNVEFEREMSPDVGGWALFREAIAGATPVLAPGVMVQFGLLGLVFTLNHPALRSSGRGAERDAGDGDAE